MPDTGYPNRKPQARQFLYQDKRKEVDMIQINTKKMIIAGFFVLSTVLSASAMEYYIATDGRDANPGTKQQPFATITHARDTVRQLRKTGQIPVTVYLRAGTYYLPETVVFTSQDSGTPDAPITYTSWEKEKVIISGGTNLNLKWSQYKNNIMQAAISDPHIVIDQLFVNGARQRMARWPNHKLEQNIDVGYAWGLEPQKGNLDYISLPPQGEPYVNFVFDPEKFSRNKWTAADKALIHIFQSSSWGNMQWSIRDVDFENHHILLGKGGWQLGALWYASRANYVSEHSRYYVENIFEELDDPGEWYFDRDKAMLYFIPPKDVDITTARVETANLKQLFVFEGTSDRPVRHITLRDLTLTHTSRVFMEPYEARLRGDWAIARLGAVLFDGAEDCAVEDCFFDAVGGNGVFMSNYNRRNTVVGCMFAWIGESAVCLVGSDDSVRSLEIHKIRYHKLDGIDMTPGPQSPNYPARCRIHNNLMYELGAFGKQTAGVYVSAAEEINISHNTICRTPRAGICLNDGCWGGHIIEFNDVFATVRETGDHGPFNSWGRDRYWQSLHREGRPCDMSGSKAMSRLDNYKTTIIRNNRFMHTTDRHSWGIDLDDGSSNYHLYNNLCLGCSVKLREGYYRTVENNVFIGPHPPEKHAGFKESNDIYTRNIYVNTKDGQAWTRSYPMQELPLLMDYNLYFNYSGDQPTFDVKKLTWQQWQAKGMDKHSVFADPMFVDPDKGDYRLRYESPAYELGFKSFPMDRFGSQKPQFQSLIRQLKDPYEKK